MNTVTNTFRGSDWNAYSAFEFKWLELVLTKGVVDRLSIITLLDKFAITFTRTHWRDTIDPAEMGSVLINDVPRGELLPAVQELLAREHSNKIDFPEARSIAKQLTDTSPQQLVDIYNVLSNKCQAKTRFVNGQHFSEHNKAILVWLILEAFYWIDKTVVRQLVATIKTTI